MPGKSTRRKYRIAIHSIAGAHGGERRRYGSSMDFIDPARFHLVGWTRIYRVMEHLPQLTELLAECREATPEWTPIYDAFVAKLRSGAVAANAPKVGELFPDFAVPDAQGRYRSLAELVAAGPIVLSFNRGGWCPFCRGELSAWGERVEQLADAGGRFVTITGEVGGRAEKLRELVGPGATILCDIDHGLALSVGLAFHCEADLQRRYRACGLDLADIYGGAGWILPVPATFVIDRTQTVRFAFADPDFRLRAEPDEVIAVLAALR